MAVHTAVAVFLAITLLTGCYPAPSNPVPLSVKGTIPFEGDLVLSF